MAAPLAILCPLSSWIAAIIGLFSESGVSLSLSSQTKIIESPLVLYLSSLPYMYYTFLLVFFCWFIVLSRSRFGYMGVHENYCQMTGEVHYGNKPSKDILSSSSNNKIIY